MEQNIWIWIVASLSAYLLGGIPFGFFAGKIKGLDIRKEGSGNIGATNVYRVMGKSWGIGVFALDGLKGALCVVLAKYYAPCWGLPADGLGVWVGISAILGHTFTPYLGFKGGKGVATSFGVLMALMPIGALLAIALWSVVLALSKYVSLSSLVASLFLPFLAWWLHPSSPSLLGASVVIGAVVWVRHRSNIGRLLKGTEHKMEWGKKKEKS